MAAIAMVARVSHPVNGAFEMAVTVCWAAQIEEDVGFAKIK